MRRHLDAEPDCIRMRVSDEYFPMINPKAGGTIYQWTLGFYVSAHQVAREFGHDDVLRLLVERSPADLQLIEACWAGDAPKAQAIRAANPEIVERLSQADRRQIAHAARNNQTEVVRLMLESGFPVDATGQHQATPLHWAAFLGNAEMTKLILQFGPPLEATDADFQGNAARLGHPWLERRLVLQNRGFRLDRRGTPGGRCKAPANDRRKPSRPGGASIRKLAKAFQIGPAVRVGHEAVETSSQTISKNRG